MQKGSENHLAVKTSRKFVLEVTFSNLSMIFDRAIVSKF